MIAFAFAAALLLAGGRQLGRSLHARMCSDVTADLAAIEQRIDRCKRDDLCGANMQDFRAAAEARKAVEWCIYRSTQR